MARELSSPTPVRFVPFVTFVGNVRFVGIARGRAGNPLYEGALKVTGPLRREPQKAGEIPYWSYCTKCSEIGVFTRKMPKNHGFRSILGYFRWKKGFYDL
jgi:hypothetical protein